MSRRSTSSTSSPSPDQGIVGLVTLTYVPNYFDILPMYIVVLAMVPAVMALARLGPPAALAGCVTLYLAQLAFDWDLPAEWWSDRPWFFDPFGWQLIFFTGFAFGSGWLPEPPRRRALFWAALLFVLAMVPLNWQPLWSRWEWLDQFSLLFVPLKDKTHFGILRYLHFLALAYLALWRDQPLSPGARPAVGRHRRAGGSAGAAGVPVEHEPRLRAGHRARRIWAAPGSRSAWPISVGFASLVAVAALARLMRAQPWRQREGRVRQPHPYPSPALAPGE